MSREIKFRVWDKSENHWGHSAYLECCSTDKVEIGSLECLHDYENKNRWVIQQYTGLKDKNNKEIYEGDIISIDEYSGGEFNHLIHSFEKAVVEWNNKLLSFVYSIPRIDKIPISHQLLYLGRNHKVVGNIFENPELLK